jgi:hypothetical protein
MCLGAPLRGRALVPSPAPGRRDTLVSCLLVAWDMAWMSPMGCTSTASATYVPRNSGSPVFTALSTWGTARGGSARRGHNACALGSATWNANKGVGRTGRAADE